MRYVRQLQLATLLSCLALALFYSSSAHIPPASGLGVVHFLCTAFVVLGILVTTLMALNYGTAATLWMVSKNVPPDEEVRKVPLGLRLKRSIAVMVVALLSFQLFRLLA